MASRVADTRVLLIHNTERTLERLNTATAQLEELNPQSGLVVKEFKERDDALTQIVSFVLATEKGGSVHEIARETESVREKARKIREEALQLQKKVEELRGCVQDLHQVLDAKASNTELIREMSKKS